MFCLPFAEWSICSTKNKRSTLIGEAPRFMPPGLMRRYLRKHICDIYQIDNSDTADIYAKLFSQQLYSIYAVIDNVGGKFML